MTQFQGNILPYKGKWPKIADDVFIAPGASVIGDVEIGAGSLIAACLGAVACGDDDTTMESGDGTDVAATETNAESEATRPVCSGDADCPGDIQCIFPDPNVDIGQCDGDYDDTDTPGDQQLPPFAEDGAGGAAGGTCLAGSDDCNDLGPADQAPGLFTSDDECADGGTCIIEPGDPAGVCDG